jgi:type VII secretion ATPase EccA
MHPDTLTYFREGLTQHLVNSDTAAASENYDWIISELDPDQCDVYLAKALLNQKNVGDELVYQAYRTLKSYGHLVDSLNLDLGRGKLGGEYHISFLDLTLNISTPTYICAAYAMSQAQEGRFGEAIEALNHADPRVPMVDLCQGVVYMYAGRWDEVVASTSPCFDAKLYDPAVGTKLSDTPDQFVQRASYLLSGMAYAHLGNSEVALGHLNAACEKTINPATGQERGGYRRIIAEARYWSGLIERDRGNENAAQEFFNRGIRAQQTDALTTAVSDTSIHIRVTSTEMIGQRTDYWDQATEPDLAKVIEEDNAVKREDLLTEARTQLFRQIGMKNVKAEVKRLESSITIARERESRGDRLARRSLHLIFTGPPGTGKTTIARVVSKIYAGLGVIEKAEVRETSRNDFVGQYQGHSTAKTVETVNSALGGILFIDEAYNLITSKDGGVDNFGVEAVGELLRLMENHRDNLIVIIAGYANDIDRFLDTNEGLASRFMTRINFTSYSPNEIADIAEVIAEDRYDTIDPEARQLILDTATILMDKDHRGRRLIDRAGNGRFSRNLVESAEGFKDERLVSSGVSVSTLSNEQLSKITHADIQSAVELLVSPIIYDDHTTLA